MVIRNNTGAWHRSIVLVAAAAFAAALIAGRAALPPAAAAAFCDTQPAGFCATLTIVLTGNGTGDFVSNDAGGEHFISCHREGGVTTGTCSHEYYVYPSGWVVEYSVTPAAGSCAEVIDVCTGAGTGAVNLTADRTSAIGFQLLSYGLHIDIEGSGSGSVGIQPDAVSCPDKCDRSYLYGTMVQLTAGTEPGSIFGGWTGACAGQTNHCSLTITGATTTAAMFNLPATPGPSAGPTATPKATSPSPTPGATPPSTTSPTATAEGSPASAEPTAISSGPGPTSSDAVGGTVTPGEPTAGPDEPAAGAAPPPDLTVVALAILGAGLLIAIGVGAGLWLTRRRPATERPGGNGDQPSTDRE